jgi:transcriptional regulator with XRE-family HTH domain
MIKTFGDLVRFKREQNNLSLNGLAKAAQLDVAYISKLEKNISKQPSFLSVSKIARVLSITNEELAAVFNVEVMKHDSYVINDEDIEVKSALSSMNDTIVKNLSSVNEKSLTMVIEVLERLKCIAKTSEEEHEETGIDTSINNDINTNINNDINTNNNINTNIISDIGTNIDNNISVQRDNQINTQISSDVNDIEVDTIADKKPVTSNDDRKKNYIIMLGEVGKINTLISTHVYDEKIKEFVEGVYFKQVAIEIEGTITNIPKGRLTDIFDVIELAKESDHIDEEEIVEFQKYLRQLIINEG